MNKRTGLLICGALAAGEAVGSCISSFVDVWPVFAVIAALVVLFGYGARLPYWWMLAVFFAGVSIFLVNNRTSEYGYRERPWMRGRERQFTLASDSGAKPSQSLLSAIRDDFSRRVGLGLEHDPETAALNRAILLGERRRLPRATKRVFIESGTIHVFAISGLHVMIVAQLIVLILAACLVPYRFVGAASIPILWCYVALIGFPPSAIRAALMASFYFLAPVFWRRPDGLAAWILAFLAVHLADPSMITNVGCALSFAVMLSIVLTGQLVRNLPAWQATLAITFAAWAAGVPIAAHVFGRITPGGLLANLILLPTAGVTVFAGAAGLLASFVSETMAAHLNNLSALFTEAMVGVAHGVARLPGANFEVEAWTFLQCAEWYALLFLVVFLFRLRRGSRLF